MISSVDISILRKLPLYDPSPGLVDVTKRHICADAGISIAAFKITLIILSARKSSNICFSQISVTCYISGFASSFNSCESRAEAYLQ